MAFGVVSACPMGLPILRPEAAESKPVAKRPNTLSKGWLYKHIKRPLPEPEVFGLLVLKLEFQGELRSQTAVRGSIMAASPAISSFDGLKRPPGPKSFGGHHQVQFKTAPAPPTPDSTDFRRRRAHTKSRAGCAACKKRHIQCDEGKPTWLVPESRDHCCFLAKSRQHKLPRSWQPMLVQK